MEGPRPQGHPGRVFVGVSLVLVVLVGACVYNVTQSFPDLGDDRDEDDEPRPFPASLAVVIGPTTDLTEESDLLVRVDGAPAGESVWITTCPTRRGAIFPWNLCEDHGSRFLVPEDGPLAVTVPVHRVIPEADGRRDCAAEAEACMVVAIMDDNRWGGGTPLSFVPDLPSADLEADHDPPVILPGQITPEGPVTIGQVVEISVQGYQPDEDLIVALCSDDAVDEGYLTTCAPLTETELDVDDVAESPAIAADGTGAVAYRTEVPRSFVPTLDHDEDVVCAERPGRCALVVVAAVDFGRTAYFPLTVVEG